MDPLFELSLFSVIVLRAAYRYRARRNRVPTLATLAALRDELLGIRVSLGRGWGAWTVRSEIDRRVAVIDKLIAKKRASRTTAGGYSVDTLRRK